LSIDETSDGAWVAEAEAARRAGRAEEARRLAEAALIDDPRAVAGRIVLALACLDLGDAEAARRALEPVVASGSVAPEPLALDTSSGDEPFHVLSDPLADLAENELERAFDHAESEPVEAWTTNRVAEAALESVEHGDPEAPPLAAPASEADAEPEAASPFATETLADLYERQGAPERARAIRRSLRGDGSAARPPAPDDRRRWVSTLERWLDNLRRASR
jgi:hypothetical protein